MVGDETMRKCPLLNLLFQGDQNWEFFILEVYEFTRGRCLSSPEGGEIRPNQIKVNLTNKHSSSPSLHHSKIPEQ